jgi:hypothetical protein
VEVVLAALLVIGEVPSSFAAVVRLAASPQDRTTGDPRLGVRFSVLQRRTTEIGRYSPVSPVTRGRLYEERVGVPGCGSRS